MSQTHEGKRPPVVVVLGHVDHGKTTLLDYIRKTSVALREAGGITQSIGAYEITHNGRRLTFIDTPGHEAFSKMRSRGLSVADLAILVVAVDDGVQPQTKEAIKIIQDAKIPYVVAINKIDKEESEIQRVKNQLTGEGVLLEGYGGSISFQPISAKTGKGVSELLDLLVLAADVEDLPLKLNEPARGVILESKIDSRRGLVATGIIKAGTLKTGDKIVSGMVGGKVKGLENFLGKRISQAGPAEPVRIIGFEKLPEIGEEFYVGEPDPAKALKNNEQFVQAEKLPDGMTAVNLILKADVYGSLEALSQIVRNLPKPDKVFLKIVDESAGDISDGDVKLAISTKSIIIGFRSSPNKAALNLAEAQRVKIITSDIVYELIRALENEFKSIDKTIIKGDLEILVVFDKKGTTQIIGGKVLSDAMLNNSNPEIVRRGEVLGTCKILNLQQNKKDVAKVDAGNECGLLVDAEAVIKPGDHLILR